MSIKDITVIIATFKSREIIKACLNSIDKRVKVILIENSNDIEIKNEIEKEFSNVECLLAGENINCRVLNVHTIKPLDTEKILLSAQETGALVTCEEHYRYGGLSSIVAQYITEKHPVPIEVVALEGYAESGTAEELLVKYKLTAKDICTAVKKVLKRK